MAVRDVLDDLPEEVRAGAEELALYRGITVAEFVRRCVAAEVRRLKPGTILPLPDLWDPESPILRMANAALVTAVQDGYSEIQFIHAGGAFAALYRGSGRECRMDLPLHVVEMLRNRYLEMAQVDPSQVFAPLEGRFSVVQEGKRYRVLLRWTTDPLGEILTLQLSPA